MTETKMEYFSKCSYVKPTGISFLLHGVLIVCLSMLGPPNPVDKPAEFTAIEIDIVPAPVVDTRKAVPPEMSASSPPVQLKQTVSNQAPVTTRTAFRAPAIPGEANDISVASADSTEAGVVGQAAAGPIGGETSGGEGEVEAANYSKGIRTPPAYRYGSKPVYPQAARKAGWEGAVVVRVLINTDGSVAAAAVKESSGYEILDEAAVQAVKRWHYSPAKKDGVPITSPHDVKVRFRLDEAE